MYNTSAACVLKLEQYGEISSEPEQRLHANSSMLLILQKCKL